MVKFLIDNNLPFKFSHWHKPEFLFVRNINPSLPDFEVWEIAKKDNLTIVTKDSDFYNRIIISEPPPKVIHFRTGNMNLSEFHNFIGVHWQEIEILSNINKLVIVFNDRMEAIN